MPFVQMKLIKVFLKLFLLEIERVHTAIKEEVSVEDLSKTV